MPLVLPQHGAADAPGTLRRTSSLAREAIPRSTGPLLINRAVVRHYVLHALLALFSPFDSLQD